LAIWLAGTAALAVIVLDQLSKAVIIREIGPDASRHTIELLLGVQLSFVRNTGSAFGLFQGQGSILTVLVFAALGFLAVFFYRNARRDPLIALALGLQIGGAIGNLIDRIRHDYVVDFVDVGRFPTFNLADSAITVGTVLLVYALLFREGQQQTLPATDADAEQPAMPQRET
jgi:signal peptidase II